jgi:hypothetical protein
MFYFYEAVQVVLGCNEILAWKETGFSFRVSLYSK